MSKEWENDLAGSSLKMGSVRTDTEGQGRSLVEKKAQIMLTKVWSRTKSLSMNR
jgi:hypothetical protein